MYVSHFGVRVVPEIPEPVQSITVDTQNSTERLWASPRVRVVPETLFCMCTSHSHSDSCSSPNSLCVFHIYYRFADQLASAHPEFLEHFLPLKEEMTRLAVGSAEEKEIWKLIVEIDVLREVYAKIHDMGDKNVVAAMITAKVNVLKVAYERLTGHALDW
jgi:hypothetical protein